jgi:hypothetical protein
MLLVFFRPRKFWQIGPRESAACVFVDATEGVLLEKLDLIFVLRLTAPRFPLFGVCSAHPVIFLLRSCSLASMWSTSCFPAQGLVFLVEFWF